MRRIKILKKRSLKKSLILRLKPLKRRLNISVYSTAGSSLNKPKRFGFAAKIKNILNKLNSRKTVKEFSLENFAFHLSKHSIFYPKTLTVASSVLNFQLINPLVTVLELKQFVLLINQLARFKNHKLFVFIQNSQLRKLFETLFDYFPLLKNRISVEKASTMQQIDPKYNQSVRGVVLFLGDVPDFVQKFFITKNFIILNALNLDTSYNVQHYKLTGDIRNIRSITWLLSFLNAVYRRAEINYSRLSKFCQQKKRLHSIVSALKAQQKLVIKNFGQKDTKKVYSNKGFQKKGNKNFFSNNKIKFDNTRTKQFNKKNK